MSDLNTEKCPEEESAAAARAEFQSVLTQQRIKINPRVAVQHLSVSSDFSR